MNINTNLLVIALIGLLGTPPAWAQNENNNENNEELVLQEIIITARKRSENLQDVPISVQAYSGDFIQQQGIVDLQALSTSVPNFSYSQAPGASDIWVMRGLGSVGSGPHFEQAVGQVFNGFFTSRSRLGRTALVDLKQVEVLRGPQGAIIGKNTSLGAVNISPNRPAEYFEGSVSAGYDFEASQGYEVQGIVSGPISDTVLGRLVVNYSDKDGWMENIPSGEDKRQREDLTSRLILETNITDNVYAQLLLQQSSYDHDGKPREIDFCRDPVAAAAVGENCRLDGVNNAKVLINGVDAGEFFELNADFIGLTLNWQLGNFAFSSLSGFTQYDMADQFDSDLTPRKGRRIFNTEDFDQLSQELRITSTADNGIKYIAGFLYMTNEVDFVQNSDFEPAPGPPGTPSARRQEKGLVETDTVSVFGQMSWPLSQAIEFTLGARYTGEQRDGTKSQVTNNVHTNTINLGLCTPAGFRSCTLNAASTAVQPLNDAIDETNTSYNTSLNWTPIANSMFYAGFSTGFKSGGFDLRGASNANTFVFDSEQSRNFEIGGKHTFNNVRFNWTLYNTHIDDLQLSSNDPVVLTQAVVAGEATARGIEFDLYWAMSPAMNISLTGTINDTEYDDFFAPCYQGQTPAQGCVGKLQDLEGQTPPLAPDYTIVLGADYTWPLSENLNLTSVIKIYSVGEQSLSVDNNRLGREDSYTKYNASLKLEQAGGRWSVSLVGRNLSDEVVRNWSNSSTALGGSRYAFIDETLAVAIKGQYKF